MHFHSPLVPGKLIRRYKRFLADVELNDGRVVTAHCTNSGSMKTCLETSAPVMISTNDDPKRKTRYTWEMIFINGGWVGINTSVPNLLAFEAVRDGKIPQLQGFTTVKREVKFLDSRLDLYAEKPGEKCFIEVKNVTMKVGDFARFPDARSSRGLKHLHTLMEAKKQGFRAVMLYIIQRMDVNRFGPAADIDPDYAAGLQTAFAKGVEIIPLQAEVNPEKIEIVRELPFEV